MSVIVSPAYRRPRAEAQHLALQRKGAGRDVISCDKAREINRIGGRIQRHRYPSGLELPGYDDGVALTGCPGLKAWRRDKRPQSFPPPARQFAEALQRCPALGAFEFFPSQLGGLECTGCVGI